MIAKVERERCSSFVFETKGNNLRKGSEIVTTQSCGDMEFDKIDYALMYE